MYFKKKASCTKLSRSEYLQMKTFYVTLINYSPETPYIWWVPWFCQLWIPHHFYHNNLHHLHQNKTRLLRSVGCFSEKRRGFTLGGGGPCKGYSWGLSKMSWFGFHASHSIEYAIIQWRLVLHTKNVFGVLFYVKNNCLYLIKPPTLPQPPGEITLLYLITPIHQMAATPGVNYVHFHNLSCYGMWFIS